MPCTSPRTARSLPAATGGMWHAAPRSGSSPRQLRPSCSLEGPEPVLASLIDPSMGQRFEPTDY